MSSAREDLEAAFDASEDTEPTPAGEETIFSAEETRGSAEDAPESIRSSWEEETKTPQELLDAKDPIDGQAPKREVQAAETGSVVESNDPGKAPAGWAPAVREEWAKLPKTVRDEIHRREVSYSSGIQRYAEEGKYGNAMRGALDPYRHVMAMEGSPDDATAIRNLAHVAGTLRMGTAQEKVSLVTNLINSYEIDIEMLDNMLVGEPTMTPEAQQMQQLLDSRLGPMEQMLQEVNGARSRSSQYVADQVGQEIYEFESKAEFLNDVRSDMADFLDMAARRGQSMTLQESYDRACRVHPEISRVIESRSTQQRMEAQRQKLNSKSNAASSMPGGSGGESVRAAETTIEALSAAWDAHSN